jgi:protein O-mannosyl-transferase
MSKKRTRLDKRTDRSHPKKIDARKRSKRTFEILMLSCLAGLVFLIYSNSLESPFIYDDLSNIQDNPNIRLTKITLEDIKRAGFEGRFSNRPIALISFALNYYFHRYEVTGYHLINILIHIITGLLLYIFVKTTLNLPSFPSRYKTSRWIPFITVLIWLVHPLNTQSVTYIVQRMNSMAAMFYILSFLLYVKGRLAEGKMKKQLLFSACILAGALSLGSKEIAATLPFFIFLYEWYFLQGLSRTWLKRHISHIAAVLILVIIGVFIYLGAHPLEKILAGYEGYDFTLGQRLLTEFRVVIFYLSLLLFPHPSRLNLDHDFSISHSLTDPITTLFSIGAIVGLIGFSIWAAKKDRLFSFGILWFLGNLLIESSVLPLEIIYEHRTYLPSMFLFLMAVLLAYRFRLPKNLGIVVSCAVVISFSVWTYERNETWRDEVTFWRDSVKKSPNKARPNLSLGFALQGRGKIDEAIKYYIEALRIKPDYAKGHNNLGVALKEQGRIEEAVDHYSEAIRIKPDYAEAHNNLGVALRDQGKLEEAIEHHGEAIRIQPKYAEGHNNLGVALKDQGRLKEAAEHFYKALRIRPDYAEAHYNLANVLASQGRFDEAVDQYRDALKIKPGYAKAHHNLGLALVNKGKIEEAVNHYQEALRINPDYADASYNLASALTLQGKTEEAEKHFNEALRLRPEDPKEHFNLARTLARQGRYNEAMSHYAEALRIKPDYAEAHNNMGVVLANVGNLEEAVIHYSQAIQIKPDYAEAQNNMGVVQARLGRMEEAMSHFSEALRIDPEDGEAHFNMGNILSGQGRLEQAVEHYSEALRIKPDDEEARRNQEKLSLLMEKSLFQGPQTDYTETHEKDR